MKNKEIEELLNEFKKGTHLFPEYREIILSYIEQLEADYKEANDSITWWTNRYNALNKEYKLLKDRNEINIDRNIEAYRIVEQLENNRDKAIEYIEEKGRLKYNPNELINILKGDSDE